MAASMELKTLTAEWFRCAVLAHGADQVDEECEHVKETEIMILRLCGIWPTTRPMADLATCCISAQCVATRLTSDLASITHASLAPGNDQRSLSFLGTLRSEKRTFMENMAVQAEGLRRQFFKNFTVCNFPLDFGQEKDQCMAHIAKASQKQITIKHSTLHVPNLLPWPRRSKMMRQMRL